MKWSLVCAVLACAVCWTCGVLNEPCSDAQTDCDVGECCSYVDSQIGTSGFRGVCKGSLKVGDQCSPGVPALGQCGCSHGMSCVSVQTNGVSKCLYLPH